MRTSEIVRIRRGEKIRKFKISSLINAYDPYIRKLCKMWQSSFRFDNAIDSEDLCQELKLKLCNDLHTYNYKKSSVRTYIKEIAKNFFLNKKTHLLAEENFPIDYGGNSMPIKSLDECIFVNERDEITLYDLIDSKVDSPEYKLEIQQLKKMVEEKLDDTIYTPVSFIRRKRSFVRVVYDLLALDKEKFVTFLLFDHRCRKRYAELTLGKRIPRRVVPNAETIARYLGVKKRCVSIATRYIKKTIVKCAIQAYKEGRMRG